MAIYQLVFWMAVLVICAGVGVGGLYWFHVRDKSEAEAHDWKESQGHRSGAQ
ncbi:MAG: hypothetical protein ABIR26_13330 [Ramlibacter sp.]